MAHPYHSAAKAGAAKKLASYGGKTKGQSFSDTKTWDGEPGLDSDKVNQPQKIPTRKAGGRVEGEKAEKRLDRTERAKGGRVGKGKTVVNVVIGGHGEQQAQPQAVPVPRPVPVPVGGPPPGGPPMGAGAPPGGPGGMPPGAMPPPGMVRKRGGRVASGPENASEVVHEFGGNGGLKRMEMAKRQPAISKKFASANNY